jgi:hypothetical protein
MAGRAEGGAFALEFSQPVVKAGGGLDRAGRGSHIGR